MTEYYALNTLRDQIDGGQAARLYVPPDWPGMISLTFLVKKFAGFYWLRAVIDHPASFAQTSTISGLPDWGALLDRLANQRSLHGDRWQLCDAELELPGSITDFLYTMPIGAELAVSAELLGSPGDHIEVLRRRAAFRAIEGGQADKTPRDIKGDIIHVGDILKAGDWRYKVLAIDTLQGSGSVQLENLQPVEPGWERRWASRYELWQGHYEIETPALDPFGQPYIKQSGQAQEEGPRP